LLLKLFGGKQIKIKFHTPQAVKTIWIAWHFISKWATYKQEKREEKLTEFTCKSFQMMNTSKLPIANRNCTLFNLTRNIMGAKFIMPGKE
jgi:hypothetical protein